MNQSTLFIFASIATIALCLYGCSEHGDTMSVVNCSLEIVTPERYNNLMAEADSEGADTIIEFVDETAQGDIIINQCVTTDTDTDSTVTDIDINATYSEADI